MDSMEQGLNESLGLNRVVAKQNLGFKENIAKQRFRLAGEKDVKHKAQACRDGLNRV